MDTSRRSGTSICDLIQTVSYKIELDSFVSYLKEEGLQPNTINTYKRILVYLFLYCEEKLYHSVTDMVSGDIRNFILYLYAHGHFQPTTISSGLAGLRKYLSMHTHTEHFIMELPTRLPCKRKIMEIYSQSDICSITNVISNGILTKRDKALCLLLIETGLRAIDVCNIRFTDIDWEKDIICIRQHKTGKQLNLPLRQTYGNAIVDYLLHERPKCTSKYLFVRELAPFTRLNGEGSSIREVLLKIERLAGISNKAKVSGSRMTRHYAASTMLKSGVSMDNISAVLGHTDPNVVSVYLSTDIASMASCTLPLPGGIKNE